MRSRNRNNRIVILDTMGLKDVPVEKMRLIIRGADSIVARGGRSLLSKLLKGSRDKKVIELRLNENPVYGSFKEMTIKDITARIDWMIKHSFLKIIYEGSLPLLVFGASGWEILKDVYTDELMQKMLRMTESGDYEYLKTFRDRNREMMLLLLEKIKQSADSRFIPVVIEWRKQAYRKVRAAINRTIKSLEDREKTVRF